MKYLIVLAIMCASLCACQKKDNTTPDAANVTFTITSPTAGQVYRSGDSVRVKATIVYPSELHGYEIRVSDSATNTVVYDAAVHGHADRFDVDNAWAIGGANAMTLKLELIATIDHDGTTAGKKMNFQYAP